MYWCSLPQTPSLSSAGSADSLICRAVAPPRGPAPPSASPPPPGQAALPWKRPQLLAVRTKMAAGEPGDLGVYSFRFLPQKNLPVSEHLADYQPAPPVVRGRGALLYAPWPSLLWRRGSGVEAWPCPE